jgi:hypothetical protein
MIGTDNHFFSYIGNVMVPWIIRNFLWFPVVGAMVVGAMVMGVWGG